jgi:nucleotide-binding universal stress UspA family protein
VTRVRAAGVTGDGHVVRAIGDHAADGRRIAEFANEHDARAIVVGSTREPGYSALFDADVTDEVVAHATAKVLVVPLDGAEPTQAESSTSASAR